ncbi:MAG TPA: DNA-directed RNA polymerase subunit alpha, partial [Acidobacteria bacterium]|nr:DNA-directed RNA polymerase subunit alpha [Acidobacteriota bacterium]
NGTITPEAALTHAARLVQGHMDIFTTTAEEQPGAAGSPDAEASSAQGESESILDREIESLELSIRSLNCLKNANIKCLRDLVTKTEKEMVEIRNFGDKSLKEVREKLEAMGLGFGMKLDL